MYIILAIVGLVASAAAKDVTVGEGGKLASVKNATASPAIWRQVNNVTFTTTASEEYISRIVIIDNREDKDGEAAIVEGGVGHHNVTIELKSPTVFRGYEFEIQFYTNEGNSHRDGTVEPDNHVTKDDKHVPNGSTTQVPNASTTQVPDGSTTQVPNGSTTQVPNASTSQVPSGSTTQVPKISTSEVPKGTTQGHPAVVSHENNHQVRANRDTQNPTKQKPLSPTPFVEDNKQSEQKPVRESKGFNPMTNDKDWQAMLDEIFAENNSTEKNLEVQPLKPEFSDVQEEFAIDINGPYDGKQEEVITPKEVPAKEAEKKA